ncbi:MAG: hypothetical protein ACE5EN_02005 [Nitrospinota bacterium]
MSDMEIKRFSILAVAVFILGAGFIYLRPFAADSVEGAPSPDWLTSYWHRPLAPQGKAPDHYSELEASLMPEDCGTCHEAQYEAWRTSRHSKSMGPGIMGQFGPPWLDVGSVNFCQEQLPSIPAGGRYVPNRLYDEKLRGQGLACAACHVRKHKRYGPPPRDVVDPDTPHDGFTVVKDFNRSEFCKSCHQFNPGERSLNGKLMENTYEQWRASKYAKEGTQCANCHMPDRKHSFAGIHSPEMVKKGMTVKIDRKSGGVNVLVTNSGTGHKLPTYVTPKIAVIGKVVTLEGEVIRETVVEKPIQWMVSMNLRQEYFDTRLNPGETFTAKFDFPEKYKGNIYEIEIRVFPDEFYRRFYESLIANPPGGIKLDLIKKAHEEAKNSDFSVYSRKLDF